MKYSGEIVEDKIFKPIKVEVDLETLSEATEFVVALRTYNTNNRTSDAIRNLHHLSSFVDELINKQG